jgi:hypothetical protein
MESAYCHYDVRLILISWLIIHFKALHFSTMGSYLFRKAPQSAPRQCFGGTPAYSALSEHTMATMLNDVGTEGGSSNSCQAIRIESLRILGGNRTYQYSWGLTTGQVSMKICVLLPAPLASYGLRAAWGKPCMTKRRALG